MIVVTAPPLWSYGLRLPSLFSPMKDAKMTTAQEALELARAGPLRLPGGPALGVPRTTQQRRGRGMSRWLYWIVNRPRVLDWLIRHGWDYSLIWNGGHGLKNTYSVRIWRYREPKPFPWQTDPSILQERQSATPRKEGE